MTVKFKRLLRISSVAVGCLLLMVACKQADDADKLLSQQTSVETGNLASQAAIPLPDLQLVTLEERPARLSAYLGQPVVLNLWATWCPPCRREMPVLEQAQTAFPDVAFVLVNQGEDAQQAMSFLESEGLKLTDVLLDPASEAMRTLKTGGLPTTFFFDEKGQMVDLHLGEITMTDLERKISHLF